jgi:hypothetical protein
VSSELWAAIGILRKGTREEALLPYRPSLLAGPYVRGQLSFRLGDNTPRYLTVDHSWLLSAGITSQLRLAR